MAGAECFLPVALAAAAVTAMKECAVRLAADLCVRGESKGWRATRPATQAGAAAARRPRKGEREGRGDMKNRNTGAGHKTEKEHEARPTAKTGGLLTPASG